MSTMHQLSQFGVVPVIVLDNSTFATPLAEALVAGGLACAEVTLRTPASLEVIMTMAKRGDMLVGAGTVLSVEQADDAIDAGAHFLVSPGLDPEVVSHAQQRGIPILPGVATASEVQAALRMDLEHVKLFPAIPVGGLNLINAFHGPFPHVRFMPTGGITLSTLDPFITHPAVFAVGGSWMVPRSSLDAGDFDEVRRLTSETVAHVASLALT